ncbi:DUF1302 domain-containing protein [Pseudomonas fluorescens]|uniref:DUF1302 domain-containing protein n=1 Tax=Pseudomonas fluorescens TaxID=294 RepID=UPI001904F1BA|nr:DUF1302 domain-containing protein [Pseudomonas fluorescens]MBD8090326.1 DUF1302 domain-containing protein [Pseudomonas fluorescens]MBD8718350.1 DUF1302 domain-containing protein [Pseudomonas fluorescens]
MEKESLWHCSRTKSARFLTGAAATLVLTGGQAAEFKLMEKEISGTLITTVSYGELWRVQGRDKNNRDLNADDGSRNFNTGLVSEVYKITSDLDVAYKNYGVFVRGSAFYDTQIMSGHNDYYDNNTPAERSQRYPNDNTFGNAVRNKAGRDVELLDAYVYGKWDVEGVPVTARFGRQVIAWGTSMFYAGGVNIANPFDVIRYRLPGSLNKENWTPVNALKFGVGLSEHLSMEAFYQIDWAKTQFSPVGTYYSETDLFSDGGKVAYSSNAALAPVLGAYSALGSGTVGNTSQLNAVKASGLYQGAGGQNYASGNDFRVASIAGDRNAKDNGQWGVSFKYIAQHLHSTEFGAYFVNYHAKLPTVRGEFPGYQGVDIQQLAKSLGGASGGTPLCAGTACGALAGGMATVDVLGNLVANRAYAENIQMYGFSFKTKLASSLLFGEIAYRPNNVIGVAATDDAISDIAAQGAQFADNSGAFGAKSGTALVAGRSLTRDGVIDNSTRVQTYNTSLGAMQFFGPVFGFDSSYAVFELASEHYRGSDLTYTAYDGSTRHYSGRQNVGYPVGGRKAQIYRDAYGYTLMLSGTWDEVFAKFSLSPFIVYKNDFKGNSSQAGNFIEGRQVYTAGLKGKYHNSVEGELAYNKFWGAGQQNALRDRDNVVMSVSYTF